MHFLNISAVLRPPRYYGHPVITTTPLLRPPRYYGHPVITVIPLLRSPRYYGDPVITVTPLLRWSRHYGHTVITVTLLSQTNVLSFSYLKTQLIQAFDNTANGHFFKSRQDISLHKYTPLIRSLQRNMNAKRPLNNKRTSTQTTQLSLSHINTAHLFWIDFPHAFPHYLPAAPPASYIFSWNGLISGAFIICFALLACVGATGGVCGGGGGHIIVPLSRTIDPRTTSSLRSTSKWSFSPIDNKYLVILLAYNVLAWVGRRLGRSV